MVSSDPTPRRGLRVALFVWQGIIAIVGIVVLVIAIRDGSWIMAIVGAFVIIVSAAAVVSLTRGGPWLKADKPEP